MNNVAVSPYEYINKTENKMKIRWKKVKTKIDSHSALACVCILFKPTILYLMHWYLFICLLRGFIIVFEIVYKRTTVRRSHKYTFCDGVKSNIICFVKSMLANGYESTLLFEIVIHM